MEIKIEVKLEGKDKFSINCFPSAAKIYADLSKDSSVGPGPLELFLVSLSSCIGVYARKYLIQHSVEFKELEIKAQAEFSQDSPARLVNIKIKVYTDAKLDDGQRQVFLRFIRNCPIHNTVIHTKEIGIGLS